MNRSDNINKYIVLALLLHSLLGVTFSIPKSVNDITTIGETGMAIQMMVLETSDEVYDKSIAAEEIRNKTNDSEEEQQVLLDNRKVGEESLNTYDTYYGRIRQIIDSNKTYPLLARQRKIEGSPKVQFTILKNGIVEKISVISSGHRILDREARRIIMISSPFPEIPSSMNKNYIDLTIPINFKLNN
jgi:protein TonB